MIRYESVIHEFDPWFNYRSTIKLVNEVNAAPPRWDAVRHAGYCCCCISPLPSRPSRRARVVKTAAASASIQTKPLMHCVCVCMVVSAFEQQGLYEFWNWFDSDSWYPLGRVVGGTVYPGIMLTAAAMYRALVALTATVQLRDVCVFTAPFFSGNTVRSLNSSSSAIRC